MEATKVTSNRWIYKMWYINTMGYYPGTKRNEVFKSQNIMENPSMKIAAWKELVWKGYPFYDSDYMPSCKRQIYGDSKIPWRREWQPTPVFLPRESHGQRSLTGYNPWGQKNRTGLKRLSSHAYSNSKMIRDCPEGENRKEGWERGLTE